MGSKVGTLYTVDGKTQNLKAWAEESGIQSGTLSYRVRIKKMTMKEAIEYGQGKQGKVLPERKPKGPIWT